MIAFLGSFLGVLLVAILVARYKRKVGLGRYNSLLVGAGTFLLASAVFAGAWNAHLGGITGEASAVQAGSAGSVLLSDMRISAGAVNNDTANDFYSNNDHTLTLYMDDADIEDAAAGDDLNWTLTLERINTVDAGSVLLECTFNTKFSSAGTQYDLIELDTDPTQDIYGYVGGTQVTSVGNKMTSLVDFTEGTSSTTKVITVDQDETGEDAMATKQSLSGTCSAGGKSVSIIFVAND